jgi:hypothetical protein
MLNITADFNLKALNSHLENFIEDKKNNLVEILKKAGEEAVDRSRAKAKTGPFTGGGFGNITWNLRGSIGYVIVKDHQIIDRYFPPLPDGDQGTAKGIKYAEEIALLLDDGDIMLIVVAGEEYAYFVEAKGYDVISGSEAHMESELRTALTYSRK